jgi:glycosyltransferase involved in cell wall biosynthesis
MNVLIAGEASVHLQQYCTAIRPYLQRLTVLTETPLEVPEADECILISFRETNPWKWLAGRRRLRHLMRDLRPDMVHLHQVNRLAWMVSGAAAAQQIPVVTTAWGSDVLLVPQRNAFYRHLVRQVLLRSRRVTADARVMIDAMMRLVPQKEKYVHIQYGIDPIAPAVKEKIIFSNRLHRPLYNIDTVLRDFAAFAPKHADWKLEIGGKGPLTDELKSLAAQLGMANRVHFTGWLTKEENNMHYARAAIYVSLPSSDGTAVSLLEAMSAGCIPVVSDLPVTREWIEDGVNGVVRKSGRNPFTEALALDAGKCAERNRQRIGSSVTRKHTTEVFYQLYQKALLYP